MNDIAALHISKAFASILKVYASFIIVKGFNIIYTACKNIKIPRWDITFLRFYYSIPLAKLYVFEMKDLHLCCKI